MFYSANPDPNLLESLTLDEVLLVIRGFINTQRIERCNAYNLYCVWTEKPVSIFEFCPLPFDDELQEEAPINEMSAGDFYKQTIESGYLNSEWWNN